jgi:hypothetical protein
MKHFNIFCYMKWKPYYNKTPEILFISTSHVIKYIWTKNEMYLPWVEEHISGNAAAFGDIVPCSLYVNRLHSAIS